MNDKITEMILVVQPKAFEELEEIMHSLNSTKKWLVENALSEVPETAAMLLSNSNKVDRLQLAREAKEKELEVLEQNGLKYWQAHHVAEAANDGIKAIKAAEKALVKIKGVRGVKCASTCAAEIGSELKRRDADIKMYLHMRKTYPVFNGSLADTRES